jgi:hypothetical protein
MTLEVLGSAIRGIVVNYSGAFPTVGSLGPGGEGTIQIVRMGGGIRFANNYFVARTISTPAILDMRWA